MLHIANSQVGLAEKHKSRLTLNQELSRTGLRLITSTQNERFDSETAGMMKLPKLPLVEKSDTSRQGLEVMVFGERENDTFSSQ